MTQTLHVVLVAALVLLCGCATDGSTTLPSTENDLTETSPTQTPLSETPTGEPHRGVQYDLAVSADDEERTFNISIVSAESTEQIFNETVSLAANETRVWNFSYPEPGNYTLTVSVAGLQEHQRTYQITERDPPSALEIAVSSQGQLIEAERY